MVNRTTGVALLAAGMVLATAAIGRAQTAEPRVYIDANVAGQVQSRDVGSTSTFPLYDETASVAISQKVGGGVLADIGGGVHLTRNLAVGLAVSIFNRSTDADVTSTIPDPIFFDKPATVRSSATGLRHTEVGTHIKVVYFIPVNEKLEVAISGGPSFIKVSHAVPSVSVATNTQNVTLTSPEESGTATGVNVGGDVNYLVTSRYGVGGFIRYAGGSVDLPSLPGLKVGGVQVGGGLRIRF